MVKILYIDNVYEDIKNKGKITSNSHQAFNNKLLLLEYENHDDSKHENYQSSSYSPKNEEENQQVNDVVNSCMRVITEDTEHSSNPISARYTPRVNTEQPEINSMNPTYNNAMPIMMQIIPEEYYYYMMKSPGPVRNRRAISTEESKDFYIDLKKIETDGRTTIMVRNIPNKYFGLNPQTSSCVKSSSQIKKGIPTQIIEISNGFQQLIKFTFLSHYQQLLLFF